MRLTTIFALLAVLGLVAAGCTTTEKRAATGAGVGAVAGGIIGGVATGTGGGALAGAAIGAGTGALIGAATSPGDCIYERPDGTRYVASC